MAVSERGLPGYPLPPIGSAWEEVTKQRAVTRQVVVEAVDTRYAYVRGERRSRVLLPLTRRFRMVSAIPGA